MNLLGTHDTPRILTILGGVSAEGKSNAQLSTLRMTRTVREMAVKRLKTAYTILATLPGIPTIFYGDEAGLEGYSDPFNRMPYPWGDECEELLDHYRALGAIRQKNSVYKTGSFKLLELSDDLLIFARDIGKDRYVTVVNNAASELVVGVDTPARALVANKRSNIFTISPGGSEIFKVKPGTELLLD